MVRFVYFVLLSTPLVVISRKSIIKPGSHGFYRFFGWEGMLWLGVSNIRYWYSDPFSFPQIISWIFLFYALYLVTAGVLLLHRKGRSDESRKDDTLYTFEKTTQLVETGIYRTIRHPFTVHCFS